MADSVIPTNQITVPGGPPLNADKLVGAGPSGEDIFNERVQLVGDTLAKKVTVDNAPPPTTDYGLTVRPTWQINVSTVTAVVSSDAGAVTLLAANANRLGAAFYNSADRALFLKRGAGASVASYTVILVPDALYELPQPVYPGIVTGIWDAGPSGSVLVTEDT